MIERLQERVKRLICERNELKAEVEKLAPGGHNIIWRDEYYAVKTQRDTLAEALRTISYLATNNRGAIDIKGVVHICNHALAQLDDNHETR